MHPPQRPAPAVGAILCNPQGEVLLFRSSKWADKFVIPAGKVEWGETLEQALRREMREETGLTDIIVGECFWWFEMILPPEYHKPAHFLCFDFLCHTQSSDIVLDEKEAQEHVWIEPGKAVRELDMEPYSRESVERAIVAMKKMPTLV